MQHLVEQHAVDAAPHPAQLVRRRIPQLTDGQDAGAVQPLLHSRADAVDVLQLKAEQNPGRLSWVMTVSPSGFCRSDPTLPRKTFGARLRGESGSDEGKVFNLVGGLQQEIEGEPEAAPVLQTLRDRAERILKDLEDRKITGLAAMDLLAALVKEKEEAVKGAQDSGLSSRAYGVYWSLKDDEALGKAAISALDLATKAEALMARFPNARANIDEHRRLRAALYRPLLGLKKEERGRIVEAILTILLDGGADAKT